MMYQKYLCSLIFLNPFLYTESIAQANKTCIPPKRALKPGVNLLNSHCIYKATFLITKSNTTLDCRGATLTGEHEFLTAIVVNSGGKEIVNTNIKNCNIKNFKHAGIIVGWNIPDGDKPNNSASIYNSSPKNTKIYNTHISEIANVGIYIDDYSRETLIEKVNIRDITGVGVYLEHDSQFTTIRNSIFKNLGWNKQKKPSMPGIAIDSSQNNIIQNNKFYKNGLAAIALYRNCSEDKDNKKTVYRKYGANNNTIKGNIFESEENGIWIASRMNQNLHYMHCDRFPYYVSPSDGSIYVRDEARNNLITENGFIGSGSYAIRVEDGPNYIKNNYYEKVQYKGEILLGANLLIKHTNSKILDQLIIEETASAPRIKK